MGETFFTPGGAEVTVFQTIRIKKNLSEIGMLR